MGEVMYAVHLQAFKTIEYKVLLPIKKKTRALTWSLSTINRQTKDSMKNLVANFWRCLNHSTYPTTVKRQDCEGQVFWVRKQKQKWWTVTNVHYKLVVNADPQGN